MTYLFPTLLIVAFMAAVVWSDWAVARADRRKSVRVAVKARHASATASYSARGDAP